MRYWVSCIFMLLALFPAERTRSADGVAYAFLVAVGDYDPNEFAKLPYTVSEMKEFRDVLLVSGYRPENIKLMCDGAQRRYLPEAEKILAELALILDRLEPNDSILVAFNGHGVHPVGDRTGYFCPIDARDEDRSKLIPVDRDAEGRAGLFPLLKACKAQRKLLLINACRNDPRSNLSQAANKVRLDDLENETVPQGIAMLSACRPGQRSYYYDPQDQRTLGRQRSLFFHHVIETWKSRGSDVTVDDLFTSVVRNVAADADNLFGRPQLPMKRREYEGEGEWYLRGVKDRSEPMMPAFPFSARAARDYQAGYAAFIGRSVVQNNSLGMPMTLIPPGEFMMGNEESVESLMTAFPYAEKSWFEDAKAHRVRLTNAYTLSAHEVTVGQFRSFVSATGYRTEAESDEKGGYGIDEATGIWSQDKKYNWKNPGFIQTDQFPVTNVSWNDCVAFCNWLSRQEGLSEVFKVSGMDVTIAGGNGYRLPSEAEWEWACRGGTGSRYWFGSDPEGLAQVANVGDATAKAAFANWQNTIKARDGEKTASAVGKKNRPNPFGLHDMHGNVWEWCWDYYAEYDVASAINPVGPATGSNRVFRGGGWDALASDCRSASRYRRSAGFRNGYLGFRVARSSVQ